MKIYKVCIPHTHRDYFDYQTEEYSPCIGARVWVPFRKQKKLGIVIDEQEHTQLSKPLKAIDEIIDEEALITAEILSLCRWIAQYYQSPLSEVLALALPKKYRLGQASGLPKTECYELIIPLEQALTQLSPRALKQQALVQWLAEQKKPVAKKLLSAQGYTSSQLLPLLNLGILQLSQQIQEPLTSNQPTKILELNHEQEAAFKVIEQALHHYHCFLLHGVTGSGKTEVYFHAIQTVLKQEKQVLVLVPEIGLTPQLLARFKERFQESIAIIHSNLNESERHIAWQAAKENRVKIILGTRAAVFTPMPSLGLIIIDEEHDASFKQMEGVRYSARDTALIRAHWGNFPIILGSATPSLESLHNSLQKKYTRLVLKQKALSNTPLHYQLIDLRSQMLQEGLAKPSLEVIKKHLDQNNQVLVFINRRGFAPIILCHQCGWMMDCKACDSHLTLHKQSGSMVCHHCGLHYPPPKQCMSCKSTELVPLGAGTQRVHEFLSTYFPKTQVLRIDKDQTGKKQAFADYLKKISQGEVQLIVGTQMLAKGHHFPRLSLVLVLDADAGLYNQDFRATEHLGQLLTQVAGRAGRAEHAGEVLIQTHLPQHPLLNLLVQQGYEAFAQALLESRQQAQLPPYHFLAVLRAQSKSQKALKELLGATKYYLQGSALTILGPAPAPLARKANQYRMQLLIKSSSRVILKSTLTDMRQWLTLNKLAKGIRWNVDVDPMDLS